MGLEPATTLFATTPLGARVAYGPHAFVTLMGATVVLANHHGQTLASVNFTGAADGHKPRVKADLSLIDGDTVTPVNAFLLPYGKVKLYWRTKEYRWHPLDGKASAPVKGAPSPSLAPSSVVEPRPTVHIVPAAAGGSGVSMVEPVPEIEVNPAIVSQAIASQAPYSGPIETMLRWQDRRAKRPVAKSLTKSMSIVDDVVVPSQDLRALDAMKKQRDAGFPAFALVTGPAGTAKTRLASAWAFVNDLPVVIVEGQSIQTAGDWFGSIIPVAGGFEWVWSDAALLILTGQPCVIVLDELNRPENERALNGVMGLTDWKATAKPVGAPHAVTLKPGQCIIATLNEGPEYVGTVEVDAAVRDRFDAAGIRMGYVSEAVEVRVLMAQAPGIDREVAKRLVRVANGQRAKRDDDTLYPSHNVLSPRALVTIARTIVVGGLDPVEAIWTTARTRFTAEDEPALSVLIEAQFGAAALPTDDLPEDAEIERMLTVD
jgi:MoxR-like ATPase